MTVVLADAGDRLTVASSLAGIGVGAFSMGIWAYVTEAPGASQFADGMLITDAVGGDLYLGWYIEGAGPNIEAAFGASVIANTAYTLNVPRWIVVSGAGSDLLRLRIFDDSASTTPVYDSGDVAMTYNVTAAYDTLVIGESFATDDPDFEARNGKIHIGVVWTDAQCRTESQFAGIQTAGGTQWGAWDLQNTDADAEGLNDLTGNARDLTNTGGANGTNDPTQMAAVQSALPIADLVTGVWTTTPLWSKIAEGVSTPDATVVLSDASPVVGEPFSVDLATITDPVLSTGHMIRCRWAKNGTAGANYIGSCELRQGYVDETTLGTLIATLTSPPISGATLQNDVYTLSAAEADTITDYSDLQLRLWAAKSGSGANADFQIDAVEFRVPDAGPPPPQIIPSLVMAPMRAA